MTDTDPDGASPVPPSAPSSPGAPNAPDDSTAPAPGKPLDWLDEFVTDKRAELEERRHRVDVKLAAARERAWSGEAGASHITPKAGRNLPAAIGVGLLLGALIIATLVIRHEAFLVLATLGVTVGAWELRSAFTRVGMNIPLIPTLAATPVMMLAAWATGGHGLSVAFGSMVILTVMWRATDTTGNRVADVNGSTFIATYPCLLAAFCALLARPDDGMGRLFVYLIVTVVSDVGGYAVGILAGRHPLAPSISPKKSWEGFLGSVLFCAVAGAITVVLFLHGTPIAGAFVGALVAAGATLGDLFESVIKRDLGIKDMSTILPGHGGLMDRIDSLLITAPLAWFVLSVTVPVATG